MEKDLLQLKKKKTKTKSLIGRAGVEISLRRYTDGQCVLEKILDSRRKQIHSGAVGGHFTPVKDGCCRGGGREERSQEQMLGKVCVLRPCVLLVRL